jgi:hypothetical protein
MKAEAHRLKKELEDAKQQHQVTQTDHSQS